MTIRALVIGSALALSVVSVADGQVQQSGRNSIVIAPDIARTVTISRASTVLTVMNIPQGTNIFITFDTADNAQLTTGNGRFAFHGNVEIRAMAASQRTSKLFDSMDQAPIHLTATGVDVAIAPQ
jgi:hypothetical protein